VPSHSTQVLDQPLLLEETYTTAVKPLMYFYNKIYPTEKKMLLCFIVCSWARDCIPFPHPTLQGQTTQVLEGCRGSSATTFYKATITATQLFVLLYLRTVTHGQGQFLDKIKQ